MKRKQAQKPPTILQTNSIISRRAKQETASDSQQSMDSSRVLARATTLANKQSTAPTSIAKATAYLSAGGWHEDASAFRNWAQAACGRSLSYLVPTRSLSSVEECRERATLYLQKASYDLEAEGKI